MWATLHPLGGGRGPGGRWQVGYSIHKTPEAFFIKLHSKDRFQAGNLRGSVLITEAGGRFKKELECWFLWRVQLCCCFGSVQRCSTSSEYCTNLSKHVIRKHSKADLQCPYSPLLLCKGCVYLQGHSKAPVRYSSLINNKVNSISKSKECHEPDILVLLIKPS